LILRLLLMFSSTSYAETESGTCLYCYSNQQSSNKIEAFAGELDEAVNDSGDWVKIKIPGSTQITQIEAGYPMGCELTSILYALKFGPQEYQQAYEKIPGSSDLEKLRSLVYKFSAQKSKDNLNQPAFSEKYGINPNDLPWMFQSLIPNSEILKTTTYLMPAGYNQPNNMIDDFHKKAISSLSSGKPMIIQLLYTNPSFSHAVVVIGIEGQSSSKKRLNVQILDPMTGKKSFASIEPSTGKLGDTNHSMLKFSDPDMTSQDGFLLSISL